MYIFFKKKFNGNKLKEPYLTAHPKHFLYQNTNSMIQHRSFTMIK